MKIIVEHKVLGAPVNDRGDGTLSVTNKVSERGVMLLSDFYAPADHASMLFFLYPGTGLYTIMHYQAKFTAFPEHNRWYDERALYELTPSEFEKIKFSYASLLPALNKFGEYNSRYYGASNELEAQLVGNISEQSGDSSVRLLKNAITQAVLGNRKIFVKLGNSDKLKGDDIRNSSKLKILLSAISQLPESWRRYISVAYGVEKVSRIFERIATEMVVFAVFDDVSAWGEYAENAVVIDWKTDTPKGNVEAVDEQKMAVLDKLISICNTENVSSTKDFSALVSTVGEKVDELPSLTVDKTKSLSPDDVSALEKWFSAGTQLYRHKDVSLRLLWLSAMGLTKVTGKSVLKAHSDLINDKTFISLLIKNVGISNNFQQLSDIFDNNRDISEVCNAVRQKVMNSQELMDACADNQNSALANEMQEAIRRTATKWSEDAIISRLDKPYFGFAVDKSFDPKSWADYERLYRKMENRKDIGKLPYSITWSDKISPYIFEKIPKRLSEEDCAQLYDKVSPTTATLNDYAEIAYNYGERFWQFIKEDVVTASLPKDDIEFERIVGLLLNTDKSKEFGNGLREKYLSLKTGELNELVATLSGNCSDFLLLGIDEARIKRTLEKYNPNNADLATHVSRLYSIKGKQKEPQKNLALKCLAEWYMHTEMLSDRPLWEKSFWKILHKPQEPVLRWFKMVSDSCVSDLNVEEQKKLCDVFVDYSVQKREKQNEKPSGDANRFVKRTARNLVKSLQKAGYADEATKLKSSFSPSIISSCKMFVISCVNRMVGMSKPWKIAIAIGGVLVIVGVVLAALLSRNSGESKLKHDPSLMPPAIEQAVDTLYYKMLMNDTLAHSVEWQGVPLLTNHPMLLFANKYLDSLYQGSVSAYVELRVSNMDTIFRLHINKDSIWFISQLRPMLDFYRYVTATLQNPRNDTLRWELKCVDSMHPNDTIDVVVDTQNSLMEQILSSEKLTGCNVVSCNGKQFDNEDFEKRNGHLRTLGRTDYYLWVIQRLNVNNKESK